MTPSMNTFRSTVVCLLSCFVLPAFGGEPAAPAPVAKEPESALVRYFSQDYMLGDWGGRRTALREAGVDLEFFYFGSVPTNLSGGIDEGSVYQHAFLFTLDLDTEKLGWWNNGKFHLSAVWLEGDPFSTTYVGDFN